MHVSNPFYNGAVEFKVTYMLLITKTVALRSGRWIRKKLGYKNQAENIHGCDLFNRRRFVYPKKLHHLPCNFKNNPYICRTQIDNKLCQKY